MLRSKNVQRAIAAIASRGGPVSDEHRRIGLNKLKFWANGGIMPLVGSEKPGVGCDRIYTFDGGCIAALLETLTEAGVAATRFSGIIAAVRNDEAWLDAVAGADRLWLHLTLSADNVSARITSRGHDGPPPPFCTNVTINLSHVIAVASACEA